MYLINVTGVLGTNGCKISVQFIMDSHLVKYEMVTHTFKDMGLYNIVILKLY